MTHNNTKCKFDTKTNRCSKIRYTSGDEPSNFCQYHKETGYCILQDNTPKFVKKNKLVIHGETFENICSVKCWVDGLGETNLNNLEETYKIPDSYNLEYGVLKRGLAVVYSKGYFNNNDDKNYIHEIKVKGSNMVIYLNGTTITILPTKRN